MSGEAETKVCPQCAETIKAAAKVCPHCRYHQKKWSLKNPGIAVTLASLVLITCWIAVGTFFEKTFGPKEEFATYRDEISVLNSQFSQRISGSNLLVSIVGTLTNHSGVGWKDVGVEAQFFNKAGKLIDAITVSADGFNGVTVLPHGETAFKIEGKALHPAADYETNMIFVRWAKDVNTWFP
jgi:hypothetical protein